MNKVKFLSILSIALLAINLGLIWFLISHKPHPPMKDGPKKIIIQKLSFDPNQISAYELLIENHKESISNSEEKLRDSKNKLYATLNDNEPSPLVDSLMKNISIVQQTIEETHYKHFLDIKMLCKPEQQKAFLELTKDIAKLFAPAGRHRPKKE